MNTTPSLLYPADTDVFKLSHSEILLLMTLRLWALSHSDLRNEFPDWRDGLHKTGIGQPACTAFDALMGILLSYSQRQLDIRCTCNRQLGSDEGWLLQMLALLQINRHWEAQAILADWIPLPVQGMALMYAMHLAESLRKIQIVVPLSEPQPETVNLPRDFYPRQTQARVLH